MMNLGVISARTGGRCVRCSSVLNSPLLRSGSVRSGGYSFLASGAGGGEADFLGEDDSDTAGNLRSTRSARSAAAAASLARGRRRSPAWRPEKARASADALAARRMCAAAARWSGVASSAGDARAASAGAEYSTYASTAVLP
nr:hypothetical protein 1 - maize transposon Mu1 [Zea mays]